MLSSSTEIILDSLCFTDSVSEYDFIANGGHGEVEVSAISRLLCLEVYKYLERVDGAFFKKYGFMIHITWCTISSISNSIRIRIRIVKILTRTIPNMRLFWMTARTEFDLRLSS